jgi:tRNA-binding protein
MRGVSPTSDQHPSGAILMKPEISYDDFAKLDLRVATILAARPHPNADKLLLLQIDVGDEQKQIVAGIRGHYEPEQLVGRQIVVVNNLQEAVLRGEESRGMLLAASDESGVVLLRPDRECKTGAGVK